VIDSGNSQCTIPSVDDEAASRFEGPTQQALQLQDRALARIPGGSHTYAKGSDQFPLLAPAFIARGDGCHVWDSDGNRFIEYGMGLRAVTLGHAFPEVLRAVERVLPLGTNYGRPSPLELECADALAALVPGAEMVKFSKDGSTAVDAAIRLARAHTGRDLIACCADHPFFSTSDWFIGTTEMAAGIPESVRALTLRFPYNDLAAVEALFECHPNQIACLVMEAARTVEPRPGYLPALRDLAHRHGALLVIDEMITGFRWDLRGAQQVYGITADLCTFGKALANGFALSAITGRRDVMRLGGFDHDRDRVFLLSTTHGAETHALAAALATIKIYQQEPVIETLYERGRRLREGISQSIAARGVQGTFGIEGRDCCLFFVTRDSLGRPSQAMRTLFMQEMLRRGVMAPSFVVSYSHTKADIDYTIDVVDAALVIYSRALDAGVDRYLQGRPGKPVFRRHG
jgi:glutamate-1-semialdehyde 2,1-aminomutase